MYYIGRCEHLVDVHMRVEEARVPYSVRRYGPAGYDWLAMTQLRCPGAVWKMMAGRKSCPGGRLATDCMVLDYKAATVSFARGP